MRFRTREKIFARRPGTKIQVKVKREVLLKAIELFWGPRTSNEYERSPRPPFSNIYPNDLGELLSCVVDYADRQSRLDVKSI